MPRVSDAYRKARRDEIVDATLRVIVRRGLRAVTMADVIEEAGLSAGSVYSHFTDKHELIELVATRVIGERADLLRGEPGDAVRAPLGIVEWWLTGLTRDEVPFGAVLQIWGEAASDPRIRAVVESQTAVIEDAFATAADRWLRASGGDVATARRIARAMLAFCQGYIVRSAVLGPQDVAASVAAISLLPDPPG